jgi:hypothetical protein
VLVAGKGAALAITPDILARAADFGRHPAAAVWHGPMAAVLQRARAFSRTYGRFG